MNNRILAIVAIVLFPAFTWSANSVYCPQRSGYINVGMTQGQVIAACGQPVAKRDSENALLQQVPDLQLIYNNMGTTQSFYGVWGLPLGINTAPHPAGFGGNAGSLGAQLQVDIVNDRVQSVKLNSSDTNGFSICNGTTIKIGDPAGMVYGACGSPSLTNKTFIMVPIPSLTKPQIWIYQPGQYQPPISLTFIDGKLQSIQ